MQSWPLESTPVTLKKLQEAGIYTCNGLMMYTKKTLCDIKGLSDAKVREDPRGSSEACGELTWNRSFDSRVKPTLVQLTQRILRLA